MRVKVEVLRCSKKMSKDKFITSVHNNLARTTLTVFNCQYHEAEKKWLNMRHIAQEVAVKQTSHQ